MTSRDWGRGRQPLRDRSPSAAAATSPGYGGAFGLGLDGISYSWTTFPAWLCLILKTPNPRRASPTRNRISPIPMGDPVPPVPAPVGGMGAAVGVAVGVAVAVGVGVGVEGTAITISAVVQTIPPVA